MDRPGKFQRLASHPQIEAACIASTRDGKVHVEASRGVERWGPLFTVVANIMAMSDEPSSRTVLAEHTMVAERDGDRVIVVAFVTGAPVSKSVRRMIRQAFGKRRATKLSV